MPYYYFMLAVAIGAVFLACQVRHSKFGLGLRAISQDEIRAEFAGVPTSQYKIPVFAISGHLCRRDRGVVGKRDSGRSHRRDA